jgi:hypothetical protein
MNEKTLAKVFRFRSSSEPKGNRFLKTLYETLVYTDGSMSCDCKGWTMKRGDTRHCKHTRMIDMGIAEQEAESFKDYTVKQAAPKVQFAASVMEPIRIGGRAL